MWHADLRHHRDSKDVRPQHSGRACFVSADPGPADDAPVLRQVGAIVQGNDGEFYLPANGNALLKIVPAP